MGRKGIIDTGISDDQMFNCEKFSAEDRLLTVSMSHDQWHFLGMWPILFLGSLVLIPTGSRKKDPGNEAPILLAI